MTDTLYKLVNPPFVFEFAGKEYNIKKANLEKAVLYQEKIRELNKADDAARDLKLAAYCIFLVLKDVEPDITEEKILQDAPADLDVIECLTLLGFMSPQRLETARKIEGMLREKLTTESSSPTLPNVPDGDQKTSGN